MRAFITRAALFVLLHAVVLVLLFFAQVDETNYIAATLDKHQRLETAQSPKIIFVGGSNLAFGLDSEIIEQELQMSAVNMGLHAYASVSFMLAEIEAQLRAGDRIVLSLEYEQLEGKRTQPVPLGIVQVRPASLAYAGFADLPYVTDAGLIWAGIITKRWWGKKVSGTIPTPVPPYARRAFNTYGDLIFHRGKGTPRPFGHQLDFTYDPHVLSVIEEINAFVARNDDVEVCFVFPPIPAADFERLREPIEHYHQIVREQLRVPLLNTPAEVAYSDDSFFDTPYHLTHEATVRRTRAMVERLR